ncbi:MAG: sigma-70 family RNA polymerase sigma factor [bacterium]|nr:sigma-70 family RNA polymerase sigma factor [bacterium]
MTDQPDDSKLIQRIMARDESALSDIYQRYSRLVYSLALRVVQNNVLAEEVTQDAFLKVWSQPQTWDPKRGRLVAWLLTITRHAAIDRLRKEQRRPLQSALELDDALNMVGSVGVMDDPAWQDGRLLRSLLEQLPTDQIRAIELAFFGGMSHSEIAESLNLPLGTVKTRVRLGLQKLKTLWVQATGQEL